MSEHKIHGLAVDVSVYHGVLSCAARARCVGKVVNLCREASAVEFRAYVEAASRISNGTEEPGNRHITAKFLGWLDGQLEASYIKRYQDDFPPTASIGLTSLAGPSC